MLIEDVINYAKRNALQLRKTAIMKKVFMFIFYDSEIPNLYTLTFELKKQPNNLLTFENYSMKTINL